MAIIRKQKDIKIRKIKDDTLVNPYAQELQMNLEQIEKNAIALALKTGFNIYATINTIN